MNHKNLIHKNYLWVILIFMSLVYSCNLNSPENLVGPLPMSGTAVPEFSGVDDAMQKFMTGHNKKAGVLGLMKNGVIVYERGYGWKDKGLNTPLPYNAMFRVASISKSITKAAIKKLIREGRLNAADKVFCLPGSTGKCWLNIEPFGTPDPRLKNLTIQNLLDHKVGWDEKIFNWLFCKSLHVARKLGIPSPPGQRDLIRFMMGQPLVRAPGTMYEYSNFGHVLLGVIIEEVTGETYIGYVRKNIFNPIGIPDSEVETARTQPEFRNPREPWYESRIAATSIFQPPLTVPMPDGGMHLEIHQGASGIVISTRALLYFMQAYWADGSPHTSGPLGYTFAAGAMPGTFAVARWRSDGVYFAAFFNARNPKDDNNLLNSTGDDFAIENVLNTAIDNIKTWPVK